MSSGVYDFPLPSTPRQISHKPFKPPQNFKAQGTRIWELPAKETAAAYSQYGSCPKLLRTFGQRGGGSTAVDRESRRLVRAIEDTRQLSEVAEQRKTAGGLARCYMTFRGRS